jgi:hypothetical protein
MAAVFHAAASASAERRRRRHCRFDASRLPDAPLRHAAAAAATISRRHCAAVDGAV